MDADPEVQSFLAQERARRLRRAAIGLGIVAAGVVGYFALRPTPCERVADRICRYAPADACADFRHAVAQSVSPERCQEALAGLDAAESMPGHLRMRAMTAVLQGLVEPLR